MDEKFSALHQEISGIHRAIIVQTRWLLAIAPAAATFVSFLLPIARRLF